MGHQGCGRPPLKMPPSPSPRKPVVWGIATGSKLFGWRMTVKSQWDYNSRLQENNTAVALESPASTLPEEGAPPVPESGSVVPEQTSTEANNDNESRSSSNSGSTASKKIDTRTMPFSLQQQTELTQEEFESKMKDFHFLLLHCRAATARTFLLVWAMLVVLCFLGGYMTPGFWHSTVFTKPWFLLGFGTTQVILMTALLCWQKRDIHRLLRDTHELFRPWRRRYNIQVAFYQTTHIVVENKSRPVVTRRYRPYEKYQGSFNFVLVFSLIRPEDIEAMELASLDGTVKVDEDESSSRNI